FRAGAACRNLNPPEPVSMPSATVPQPMRRLRLPIISRIRLQWSLIRGSMKLTVLTMIVLLSFTVPGSGRVQRKRKPASRPAEKPASAPTIVGAAVTITKKDGGQVSGQVLALSASSIQVKTESAEPAIQLDTVSSISFGPPAPAPEPPKSAA